MATHQLRTLPLDLDLTVFVGASLRREFRWLPSGDAPQDFTGWHSRMLIGPQGGDAIVELSDANGGVILTDVGQIIITVAASTTSSFAGSGKLYESLGTGTVSRLFYSLDLIDPSAFVVRFARGRLDLILDVRPPS